MDQILFIAAAVCFGIEAVWHKSLTAAGFCFITLALWVL